ncbi:MAG: hypothetical protein ACPGVP_11020 [Thiolinea sp.]
MAKRKRHRRVNPVATAPILRKGGVHTVSRSGERQREKQKVKKLMRSIKAGLSGLDGFWDIKTFALTAFVIMPAGSD